MIHESFFFFNKENYNNILEFIPFEKNDPKDIILQNIEEDNSSFPSIDKFESYYHFFSDIEGNKNNSNLNTENHIFINTFPDKYFGLNKFLINNDKISEELKKFKNSRKIIFEIIKDENQRKEIQIKKHKNSSINKNKKLGITINKEDKYFPFNEPKGLNFYFNYKFYTKKYSVKENGKKRKTRKGRKFKSDDIRKKIKSRFHKEIKNILNKNLKKCGSKKFFYSFPQCFISNVSKIANSKYLNLTFKELLSNDFRHLLNNDDYLTRKVAYKKYLKNKEILDYLEQNPEISKLSGFSKIKNIKYKDLLNKYFNSEQFEKSILQLKNEKESQEYIIKYITKAKQYVDFYSIDILDKNKKIFLIEKI